jgi:hypothetical protein
MALPVILASALPAAAQTGDPQLRTDHPYFAGEGAMSTPARCVNHAMGISRGALGNSSERDRLVRMFLWRAETFSHQLSPSIYNLPGVTPDPAADNSLMIDYDAMRSLFSYGFGLCGTNHGQMRVFAEAAGWQNRRRALQGDTGHEILVEGVWRYVNTDQYTLHFQSNSSSAHFASLDDVVSTNHRFIEWNPDLGMGYRLPQANTHGSYQDFAGVTGTVANRSLQWRDYYQNVWNILPANSYKMYGEGYTAAPVALRLRRGETFTRWLDPAGAPADLGLAGRLWWGFKGDANGPSVTWSFVQNAPARDETPGGAEESSLVTQRYGNGCFDWQPALAQADHLDGAALVTGTLVAGGSPALRSTGASTLVLEHYSPYAIAARPTGGTDPAGASADGAKVYASTSGSIDVEVSINAGATWSPVGALSGGAASLDFTDFVKGRNAYLLRLAFGDAEGLNTLRLRTIVMLNQAVYPNLKDGGSSVTYSAANQGALDLSPDLWTAGSAGSVTGYVKKVADSGNLTAIHYGGGSTYAYGATNNNIPLSLTYEITMPPGLASQGASWRAIQAAMNASVRVPPAGGPYGKIEIASALGGPWTEIGNHAPPADGELSSYWVYGRSGASPLGGTTHFVRFTAYNGGYTENIRYLRLYATYALPAAGKPTLVTYHWNDGSEKSFVHAVPPGAGSDGWTVPTLSGVAQRKVVLAVPSSAPVAGDSDGDAMSDASETTKGFNSAAADEDADGMADGYNDWDGDGVLNKDDATPGTAPAPAASGGGGGGGGGGCGALGAEALLLLLLRRRRRR